MKVGLRVASGQWMSAEDGGGREVVANRGALGPWETFDLVAGPSGGVGLRAANGQWVSAANGGGGRVLANTAAMREWETFQPTVRPEGTLGLRAMNGQWFCAEGGGGREVVANRPAMGVWETFGLFPAPGRVALQASAGRWVSADRGGGSGVFANGPAVRGWEKLLLTVRPDGRVGLQAPSGQWFCAEGGGGREVVANRPAMTAWETFRVLLRPDGSVGLQAANGQWVSAVDGGGGRVVANGPSMGGWETFRLSEVTDTVVVTAPAVVTGVRVVAPGASVANLGGMYARIVNEMSGPELVGLIDMHVHPTAHLGFGRELFYGAPDGDPAEVLGNCNHFHGGYGLFDNQGGNELRRVLVDQMQSVGGVPGWDHKREGWSRFPAWPSWHDRLHQQARWEWLERAWRGGLRSIVALAVNSHTLAAGAQTKGPYDDRTVGDDQIQALYALAAARPFMRIVKTAAEFRQTVRDSRLAVVLGVELDCLGNFYSPFNRQKSNAPYVPSPTAAQVKAEVDRLYGLGVRYVFPVHITDNVFGGAAVYDRGFDAANRYQFGKWFDVEKAPEESGIGYAHGVRGFLDAAVQSVALGINLTEGRVGPPGAKGHRNARGLQAMGRVLIEALMDKGMMIDIDHMSERTVIDTLPIVRERRYPICAGHNGVRGENGSERAHSAAVADFLYEWGGSWGLGLGNSIESLASAYRHLRRIVPGAVAGIGSDCCGLDHLPAPRFAGLTGRNARQRADAGMVVYRDTPSAPADALERCRFGERTWDYSLEGMSHIGLLPDMMEEIVASRLLNDDEIRGFFRSAERFAKTWEICESRARPRHTTPSINRLHVTFRTGGDDLRGGNDNVNLILYRNGVEAERWNNVNRSARWGNNTTYTVDLDLATPLPPGPTRLAALEIETTFGGGIGGDNWNMDEVRVLGSGDGRSTTLATHGYRRFTADQKTLRITLA